MAKECVRVCIKCSFMESTSETKCPQCEGQMVVSYNCKVCGEIITRNEMEEHALRRHDIRKSAYQWFISSDQWSN